LIYLYNMMESIVSGIVQGVAEWLPISSEGILVLLNTYIFKSGLNFTSLISYILFLHLGTFFAALIYFRKEVWGLFKSLLNYKGSERKKVLNFYIISTAVTGLVGLFILKLLKYFENFSFKWVIVLIGFALLATAILQFKSKEKHYKEEADLRPSDGVILGVLQGFSIIPGLSRSGLTVAGLLLRKFSDSTALKISFIMSLPAVLAGNIVLNLNAFAFNINNLAALAFSFLFGILTIHILLKVTQKINFAWFVLIFAIIVLASAAI
jgi:undecaprenyl-diphosphatase